MRSNYKKIGPYIEQVNVRNKDLRVDLLLGVSIQKILMPSIANTVGTNMETYKIIENSQFAYGPVTSRNGNKVSVGLLEDYDEAIVSQAYTVFKITDTNKLLPEYLMMWFRRPEFDRYARFKSHGSARETFDWDELCGVELPIPSPEKQREIVDEYNTVVNRIKLNEELINKLEETARTLYKHWFVDFQFPISNEYADSIGKPKLVGKPYKLSGGEMVYNTELNIQIPKIWTSGTLLDLFELQRGFDLPKRLRKEGRFPIYAANGITDYHHEFKVSGPGVVTGRSGSLGEVFFIHGDFWALNTALWIKKYTNSTPIFAYYVLKSINLLDYNGGSAVPTLNRNHLHRRVVVVPSVESIKFFSNSVNRLHKHKEVLEKENETLEKCNMLLLNRLALISSNFLVNEIH